MLTCDAHHGQYADHIGVMMSRLSSTVIVRGAMPIDELTSEILHAINRGEGLQRPERLGASLALQLRQVEHGTVLCPVVWP